MISTSKRLWVSAFVLLGGCAITNTGAIDYRRAGTAVIQGEVCNPSNETGTKFVECPPHAPAALYLKNFPTGAAITSSDAYSISLDHALINDIIEAKFSQRRLVQIKNPFRTTGEIVILANAFEFPNAKSELRFLDFSDFSKAKVIYYNPDVQEGQNLNLSNIPIIPPTKYNGRPVGIQIVILELDRTNAPTKALLGRLAALGQATGVIPGGPIAETLLSIGQSMLLNDHDDVNFEYRFVLDPVNAATSVPSAPFEEGRYVIRRSEQRTVQPVWRNMRVDANTGQLFVTRDGRNNWQRFKDDTYLTLLIRKHSSFAVSDSLTLRTFEDLEAEIVKAANSGPDHSKALDELVTAMKVRRMGDELIETIGVIGQRGVLYGRTIRSDGTVCPDDRSRRQSSLQLTSLRMAIENFRSQYTQSEPAIDAARKAVVMAAFAEIVAPFPEDTRYTPETMSKVTAFDAFVSDDVFTDHTVAAMKQNRSLPTCPGE